MATEMSEAERLVRETWSEVSIRHGLIDQDEYGYWGEISGVLCFKCRDTGEAVAQEMAEFTRERLEEIRQVEREITRSKRSVSVISEALAESIDQARGTVFLVRELCAECRTAARLEEKLTDLKRGLREGAK